MWNPLQGKVAKTDVAHESLWSISGNDDAWEYRDCSDDSQSEEETPGSAGVCPDFAEAEHETFIGMYYMMGMTKLPKIDDYRRADLWYTLIADGRSRNRFFNLHRTLHFADNSMTTDDRR